MKKSYIIILVLGWLLAGRVLASGVSITPSKLNFNLTVRQAQQQNLTVKNITSQAAVYNLYVEELVDWFDIQPEMFRLDPGEQQTVRLTVKPRVSGVHLTNLAILAETLDRREFNATAGVKLPLEIRAEAAKVNWLVSYWWLAVVLLGGLAAAWLIWRAGRKKSLLERINLLGPKPWWKKLF